MSRARESRGAPLSGRYWTARRASDGPRRWATACLGGGRVPQPADSNGSGSAPDAVAFRATSRYLVAAPVVHGGEDEEQVRRPSVAVPPTNRGMGSVSSRSVVEGTQPGKGASV